MGTFNVAKMADLRNLDTDGPTVADVVESGIPICFLAGEYDAVLRPDTVRRRGDADTELDAGARRRGARTPCTGRHPSCSTPLSAVSWSRSTPHLSAAGASA